MKSGIKSLFRSVLVITTLTVLVFTSGIGFADNTKSDYKAPVISNVFNNTKEEDPFGDQRLTFLVETFKGNDVYLEIYANGELVKKERINAIEQFDEIKGGIKADGGVKLVISELFDTTILDSNIFPYYIEIKVADNPEFENATVYATDLTNPTPIFAKKSPETVRKFEELLNTLFKSREDFLERHKTYYNHELSFEVYQEWEWSYVVSNKIGDETIEARVKVDSYRRNHKDIILIDLVPGPEVILEGLGSTPEIQYLSARFRDKKNDGFTMEEVLRLAGIDPMEITDKKLYFKVLAPSVYLMFENVKDSIGKEIYSIIEGENVKQDFHLIYEQFYVQPLTVDEFDSFVDYGWGKDLVDTYIGIEYRYFDDDMNFKKEPVKEIHLFTDGHHPIFIGKETNNILHIYYLSSDAVYGRMPYDKKDYISIPNYIDSFESIAEFNEIDKSEYYKNIISDDLDEFEQFIDEAYSKYILNEE